MSATAAWIDWVTRLIPLAAALLVLIGVLLTVRQRDRADRKDQWWKRVEWAAEAVASADERRRCMGMSMLTALVGASVAVEPDDIGLLQAIIDQVDVSAFAVPAGPGLIAPPPEAPS